MSDFRLTRRSSLLLPFVLAACEPEPTRVDPPLRYNYLKPIDLAVKTIEIEIRFAPGGVPGDMTREAPLNPVASLRQMGEDRLKALGTTNRGIFSVLDASIIRRDNAIQASMEVRVEIVTDNGQPLGYVQAQVTRTHTGRIEDRQQLLRDMVSGMLDDMNIELEHQVRTKLKAWLADEVNAVPAPVEEAPLAPPPLVR